MRHRRFTVKNWRSFLNRRVLMVAGVVLALVLLVILLRPEPKLRNSPEVSIIADRGALRVGVRTDMPGFGQEGIGLEIDLARLFAQNLLGEGAAAPVVLVPVDARTAGAKLDQGDIDVVLALQVQNQQSQYLYSNAYYTDDACFAVLEQNQGTPISAMKIGVVQTSALYTRLTNKLKAEPAYAQGSAAYASYPDLLRALSDGEIGAAYMAGAYLRRYGQEGIVRHTETLGTLPYALMCSTDAPALCSLFNMLLDDLSQSGRLDELRGEHGL